ncbi:MAG: protein-L-isoaspartate(D-aspartate) O-methyltransferase [Deltaproteobacteria bacterium]
MVTEQTRFTFHETVTVQKMGRRPPAATTIPKLFCLIACICLPCITLAESPDPYVLARQRMVVNQLKARDITHPKVLKVMGMVRRHLFVSPRLTSQAYSDHPLPIAEGQTISQPYIVALMTQILDVQPGEKVLEIGTGSGYQAAVLSHFTDQVWSIEIRKALAQSASRRLETLGYNGVRVRHGDGYFGWPEYAPFDAIMMTAAANHVPPPLLDQLKMGGRLLLPLGSTTYYQTLTKITKTPKGKDVEHLLGVVFVPMVGKVLDK